MLSCRWRLGSRFHRLSLVQFQVTFMDVRIPQSAKAILHQALEFPSNDRAAR